MTHLFDLAGKTALVTGSGGGLKLFCNGVGVEHPDITNASRRIKASEIETCATNGVKEIIEVKAATTSSPVGYSAGRGAERTFWRHIGDNGWLSSVAFHPFVVLGSLLGAWNRVAGYTQLLGRAISACGSIPA